MQAKMTDKHKLMAYLLNKDMGYSMVKIGQLMGVAQSTISNAVKEVEFRRAISNLEAELNQAKMELQSLGYVEPTILPYNSSK